MHNYLLFLAFGLVVGLFITNYGQWGYITNLESRIEILEMESKTNKLLLQLTQRLIVPNERALKERIK